MFDVNFVDKATFTSLHNWVLLKKIILAITKSILLIMRSSQSWVFEESFWYFLKSVLKRLKISPSLPPSLFPFLYHSLILSLSFPFHARLGSEASLCHVQRLKILVRPFFVPTGVGCTLRRCSTQGEFQGTTRLTIMHLGNILPWLWCHWSHRDTLYHVVISVVRDFKKAGCNSVNCEPNTVDYLRPFFYQW